MYVLSNEINAIECCIDVNFVQVVAAYNSDDRSPTLKGISFTTKPGEKIGVVGRTGAGKA